MKVLQINIELNINSTGKIVEHIGLEILNEGWQSYAAYSRSCRPSKSQAITIGSRLDILMHGALTRLFGERLNLSTRATRGLIKEIKRMSPDIIHLHQLHGYYLNVEELLEFFTEYNRPVVYTLHDCWPFTGHCPHFALVPCDKWKSKCYSCPIYKKYPSSWFVDRSEINFVKKKELFGKMKHLSIVTVSRWMEEQVRMSFLGDRNIFTIYNGVDPEVFYPRKYNTELKTRYGIDGEFIVLAVGTVWEKFKGIDDLVELSHILPEGMQIVIVGTKNNKMIPSSKTLTTISKTDNVDDLAELYSMANVVVSFSYLESFGLTPIEGMACGTPAIVYNRTALPELVDEDTGFVLNPKDYSSAIRYLETIKNNGKEYYRDKCVDRVRVHYNKNNNYKTYIEHYLSLVNS
jgi:putative colanic acid biosynthesis glycosyltransferase